MFIYGAFSAAGRAGKALCGCICILVVGGPIMIIIAMVLFDVENIRANDDIATFNRAVAAYNSVAQALLPATFSTSSTPLSDFSLNYQERSIIPASNNTEGVASANSSFLSGNYTPESTLDFDNFIFRLNNTEQFASRAKIDWYTSESVYCSKRSGCTVSEMGTRCRMKHRDGVYTGGSCSYRSSCGICNFPSSLSEYCVVVNGSFPYFTRDHNLSSCFYPFSTDEKSQKYRNLHRGSISVTVRHSSDPFIVLQRISEGSMDFVFRVAEAQQKGVGTACLIIGILMIVVSCGLMFCFFCLFRPERNQWQSEHIPNDTCSSHEIINGAPTSEEGVYYIPPPPGPPLIRTPSSPLMRWFGKK